MASSTAALSQQALFLRNLDRLVFDQFVAELEKYVNSVTVAVTDAPQENILNMQGRAQMARSFLRVFHECDKQPTPP
jgi:hypothetical protein